METNNKLHPLIKKEWLMLKRNAFMFNILLIVMGYVGITLWLNAIRASASLWFVWVLIIIQFTLYCLIFSTSYLRFRECGHKKIWMIPFFILTILGRVENWELVIIPLLVVSMLAISARNNNLSEEKYSDI